jgi:hypothetical protein
MISYLYIVVENGEAYQQAYITYESSVNAIKTKYQDIIEKDLKDSKECGYNPCCKVNVH